MFQGTAANTQRLMIVQLMLAAAAVFVLTWAYALAVLAWYCLLLWVSHHAGLHRYFSHKSYKVNDFWHVFLCLTSCLICFGSPAGYTLVHRAHHAYTDSERDPHSQQHIGPLNIVFFNWNFNGLTLWSVTRDLKDSWIRFTHNYYIAIVVVFYCILLAIDPMLALSYSLGNALALFAMGFINTVCHSSGFTTYRNHKTKDSSSNSYLALLIGEWHNNHHAHPRQWNQHEQWWEIDPAAYFIRLIKNES